MTKLSHIFQKQEGENKGTTMRNLVTLEIMLLSYATITETHTPAMDIPSVPHLKETCSILLYIMK